MYGMKDALGRAFRERARDGRREVSPHPGVPLTCHYMPEASKSTTMLPRGRPNNFLTTDALTRLAWHHRKVPVG
jgi:hypothetical protein